MNGSARRCNRRVRSTGQSFDLCQQTFDRHRLEQHRGLHRAKEMLEARLVRHRAPQQGAYTLVDEPDLSSALDVSALRRVAVDLQRLFA